MPSVVSRIAASVTLIVACLSIGSATVFGAEPPTGQAIYKAECSRCHGNQDEDTEQFNPDVFTSRWEGPVFPSRTGDYEFVVRTEHALRLWVNDLKKPVIDAMVKSGQDTEYRVSAYLIVGRSYSIRLDISKG